MALNKAGEQWALSKGCTQFASDIEVGNDISFQFHLKAGFKVANTIICLIKDL
ncbi:MAG TPA: hypothetical protein P5107_09690 [Thermotogota bacterium]|nr:hypothetical protein [Thermotogota bacterium]